MPSALAHEDSNDTSYYDNEKPPKPGFWEILTCRACQTDDYGAFSGVDDSVHVMLHAKGKKKKKSNVSQIGAEHIDPLQVSNHGTTKAYQAPTVVKNGSK